MTKELLTSILLVGPVVSALVADKIGRRATVRGAAAAFVIDVTLEAFRTLPQIERDLGLRADALRDTSPAPAAV